MRCTTLKRIEVFVISVISNNVKITAKKRLTIAGVQSDLKKDIIFFIYV
jgi:hypothetical protein